MCGVRGLAIFCVVCGVLVGLCAENGQGRLELIGTNVVLLGTYPNTEDRTARVQIKNVGKGTLRIERVVTTCKCMRVDAFPQRIEPGDQGEIAVSIRKNEVAGRFERIFWIDSDDLANRIMPVRIQGNAIPLFFVTCDVPTALGPVDAGLVWTGKFSIAATESGLFLGAPTVKNQGTRCDYSIRTNRQEQTGYEVTQIVTFQGDGLMESALVFPVLRKDGQKSLPVRLVVEAVRKRPLKVTPSKILVTQSGASVKRRLLLSVDAGASLDLGRIHCETELGAVEISPRLTKSGKGFFIDLVFPADTVAQLCRVGDSNLLVRYGDWSIEVPIQLAH